MAYTKRVPSVTESITNDLEEYASDLFLLQIALQFSSLKQQWFLISEFLWVRNLGAA